MPADIHAPIAAERDGILAVAARYGVTNVRIFGSVARREVRVNSGPDLLVTFPPGASLLDLIDLEQDLADLLGLTVEVALDRGLRERIRAAVTQEAAPLRDATGTGSRRSSRRSRRSGSGCRPRRRS